MIINNSYFTGNIYIPHAKPGITDSVKGVSLDIVQFIEDYERECLMKCLGYALSREFMAELDDTKANGLKNDADTKWDELLNGVEYVDPDGNTVKWEGIRRKVPTTSTKYNKSFLADYVYFMYEQDNEAVRGQVGHGKGKAKNMEMDTGAVRAVKAWRRFVKLVQGENASPTPIEKFGGYVGLDWYQGGTEISLYKFINDKNTAIADTYADFNPKTWNMMNVFGI